MIRNYEQEQSHMYDVALLPPNIPNEPRAAAT